eukprot:1756794-Rhodomonas_salina.1
MFMMHWRVAGNTVEDWGGGLQVFSGSVVELGSGVVMEGNSAGNDGGAIALAIGGHTKLYGGVELLSLIHISEPTRPRLI